MRRIVIVGGSLAGHHAAASLRQLGFAGDVVVVGAERHRPYDRFPLSKGFLTGQTSRPELDVAGEVPDVIWRLGARATAVDLSMRAVIVEDRERIEFDGLVVASGARPRDVGSVAQARGAFVLRTVEDAIRLRAALRGPACRVVVVGGGLIGAEIAATAVEHRHHTILVHTSDVPTGRALGHDVAKHLLELHRAAGIDVRPRTRVRDLKTSGGLVLGVTLNDDTCLSADLVVMATGTRPNVEWLAGSGLRHADGLDCRGTLHAVGNDRVVGAGDVVRAPHPLLGGESVRMEHWASTRQQAARAAENLLAGPASARPLTGLPEFGTTIHGARIRAVGFPQLADRGRVVWGSFEDGAAVVRLYRGRTAVAAISVNAATVLPHWAPQVYVSPQL
ncbi:NAD(P)/FAD-dependent oxidoreductase [Nocardioides eburneiflavus]|uniref:NAD(P)/FAD-dependent oxidoreductase n=1 Tax=Nocardioides eburneiflavus TaxID=2518372 RepID=UPI00143D1E19|nr:FAD/NAD(P)-binding oxidoreductase [Nocardioides eburneiflavus]